MAAISLCTDFDAQQLRLAAKRTKDGAQARRLLVLAAIYDGASRTEAAMIGGVTLQVVRDWVLRFNARGPDGLINGKAPGKPSRLNDTHRAALVQAIEAGPVPATDGVVRWRLIDLCRWLWDEFGVRIAKPTLSRELRMMGYRKLTARPRHHAQAEGVVEAFKKVCCGLGDARAPARPRSRRHRGVVRRPGAGRPEEQDHAPLGQTRLAPIGTARPAHGVYLHLWRDLPQGGQGGRADPAMVHPRDDGAVPGRTVAQRRAGAARRAAGRPGGLAHVGQARRARQHHHRAIAAQVP